MTLIAPSQPPSQRRPAFRSPKYLKSANGRPCDVCGSVGTTVFAHMRVGNEGGMGLKPSDKLGAFLCHTCHMWQEAVPGYEWWAGVLLKALMHGRYKAWEKGDG